MTHRPGLGALLAGLLLFPAAAFGASAHGTRSAPRAVPRPDVGRAFSAAVCAGKLGNRPFGAWQTGVYDAQVEGRMIASVGNAPVTDRQLERKARALATLRGAGGFAYGRCDAAHGWAVALPAPSPLLAEGKSGRLKLPLSALGERCESYRADFAPAKGGAPRSLPLQAGALPTNGLGDGVLSVTCQPRNPRWRGPVLWYLYPVGKGPAKDAPEAEVLAQGGGRAGSADSGAAVGSLGPWINRVRAKAGLPPLSFTTELNERASLLATDGSLAHDRQLLKKVSDGLAATNTTLLGEDRVKGSDAANMAWLLWNSPRHRDLLLRRDATVAGLAARAVGDEQLAVLIVGSGAPLSLSKAKSATPPKKGSL